MGSVTAQIIWSVFLIAWDWKLYSAFGLAPMPRVGSADSMVLWLGNGLRQNSPHPQSSSQNHWVGSADLQSCWLESLLRHCCKRGCTMVYLAAQFLGLGSLVWEDWMPYSIVGGVLNLLPCPGGSVEQSPWPVQLSWLGALTRQNSPLNSIARQSDLLRSVDGQSGWMGYPHRRSFEEEWSLPVSEYSLLNALPHLLHSYLIFCGQVPEISPVIPMRWDPRRPSRKHPRCWGSWCPP